MSITHPAQVTEVTGGVSRSLADKLGEFVSVKDYGAKGDGTTDDTAAIQAAINTGNAVFFPSGTYKLTNSLYLSTLKGQQLSGDAVLTMDAGLGKPCMWIGAQDATGTATSVPILNTKIRGLRFDGTGTPVIGSAGIAFKSATTTTLDGIYSWGFYAGIDVRGVSISNTIINADLRKNTYGLYDRTDASTTIDFGASRFIGGRIEQNVREGVLAGSAGLAFIGTTIEDNALVADGGNGTDPEIRLTAGFLSGTLDLTDVYMESRGAKTAMIRVDDPACRFVNLTGGTYNGLDATNRYIIETNSTCTWQSYTIQGGDFHSFKNYVHGSILNGSKATIVPGWSEFSRDAATDLIASAGAVIWQFDRVFGIKTNGVISSSATGGITAVKFVPTAASGANAIEMTSGAFLNLGGTSTISGASSGQVVVSGSLYAGGSGNQTVHAATLVNDSTVNAVTVKGSIPDAAGNIACKIGNVTSLTNATAKILSLYSDNLSTKKLDFDLNGKQIYPTGGAADVAGRAVLVAGTKTVSTTAVTANSVILLTAVVGGGTIGVLQVGPIVAGTSFVINSVQPGTASTLQAADTSTVAWLIIN